MINKSKPRQIADMFIIITTWSSFLTAMWLMVVRTDMFWIMMGASILFFIITIIVYAMTTDRYVPLEDGDGD